MYRTFFEFFQTDFQLPISSQPAFKVKTDPRLVFSITAISREIEGHFLKIFAALAQQEQNNEVFFESLKFLADRLEKLDGHQLNISKVEDNE